MNAQRNLLATPTTSKEVAKRSAKAASMLPALELVSALMGGTTAIRAQGVKCLPKWNAEEQTAYDKRLSKSTLFPAFKRTIETLAARPFSKPITLVDVPLDIEELLDDCNLEGQNLDQVAAEMMQLALGHGMAGFLVDHKRAPNAEDAAGNPRPLSKAETDAMGLRPYLVTVHAHQILGWRSETKNGDTRLTQLRFRECVMEPDGEFGEKEVEQVRVLEPGRWRVFRKAQQVGSTPDEWVEFDSGPTTLAIVPFVPVYGDRVAFMIGKPPLLELAHLNVKHYQSQSDQDTLLHVARVPLLVLTGVEDDPQKPFVLVVGASGAVSLPLQATLSYVEHTGAAIDSGKVSLDDLKDEMRQSGAELLVITPGPTTATEVASDNAVGMCALQRITLHLQDALNEVLELFALWMGKTEAEAGEVKLFSDFGAATLAEASAQLLVAMATAGKLSNKTLITELKRRGILSADVDYDEEQAQLELEGPVLPPLAPPLPAGTPPPPTGKPPASPVPPPGGPSPAPKPFGGP